MRVNKVLNLLTPGFTSPNGAAFLFPFKLHKEKLREAGFEITFFKEATPKIVECDALLIDSKFFKDSWNKNFDKTLSIIQNFSAHTNVLWFDQNDSSGTLLGQVLPYVTKYYKAQLLKDRNLYLEELYGSRIYTDYYHKTFGVQDEQPYLKNIASKPEYLKKLGISWNSGLMNHGYFGPYLQLLYKFFPYKPLLHFRKPIRKAESTRPIDLSCRMGISYQRNTIAFQRKLIRKKLFNQMPTNKLTRKTFFNELVESKVCLSPFGLGEITLKDFECFLTGTLLMKPSMAHLETWPNFYIENETFVSHSWDLSDIEEKIEFMLNSPQLRIDIAQYGQDTFHKFTKGNEASGLFLNHFEKLIRDIS